MLKYSEIICSFFTGLILVNGIVFAADPTPGELAKKLDIDSNGKITLTEFLVGKTKDQKRRRLFFQYDTNEDLSLSYDELKAKISSQKLSGVNNFRYHDKNSDGELSLKEYLPLVASTKPQLAKRNFNVVDFNGNGQLSLEEFKALPGLLPVAERGAIPDPIAELASTVQQKWDVLQKSADQNKDGQLSQAEWPQKELQKQLTPLADVKFTDWDADQNGQVTSKEAAQLIAVAYGMRETNGAPLRATNGLVLYRSYIQPTDKDNDYRLSKEEYLPSIRRPKEQVQAEFTKMDADKDGFLNYQELTKSNTTNIDEFSYFLNTDKDLDGLLSAEELLKVNSNDSVKSRLPQGFAAFDKDRDGKLNLREFRLAPIGCSYVTLRIYGRTDLDHDAALSWKEFYIEDSPEVIGLAWELFRRFDRNQSGKLETSEIEFQIEPTKLSPQKAFTFRDKNADGALTLEEYLALVESKKLQLEKRNFNVVDFDGNGQLSLEEFKTLPDLLPLEKRSTIPDPIAELVTAAQQKWDVLQKTADQNNDGQLSAAEWPQAELQKQLTPLANVKFKVWDADQDGQVTQKEAAQLMAVAYGMRHVTGAPLRTPNGRVIYRSFIRRSDKNGDHRLSKDEYRPSSSWSEKQTQTQFKILDADQDGFLTYQELAMSPLSNIDELRFFLSFDKDLDGLLSSAELLKAGLNGVTESRLSQGLKAFDEDGDGKFSLREFRLAPVGCSYITLHVYDKNDLDHDAVLSWEEFYQEPSPQVIGLAWELFRRFDRNQNGQLELNEFEFRIDSSKLTPEKAFTLWDKNSDGELSLEEYLPLVASTKPQLAKRNFNVVDFNGNGQLSMEEFKALPGLFPVAERGAIPDPIAELASTVQQKWDVLQKAADQNKDGQLSQAEWPQKELHKQLTPLADVKFTDWDADQNGQVTSKEAAQLIAVAYGMRETNGAPLRATNGLVLYRSYIQPTDKDNDYRLSEEEYLPSIRRPKKQVQAEFTKMDADKDGFLNYQELTKSNTTNIDEFSYFLNTDKDLDGLLSAEELLKINSNDVVDSRLPQGFAAFDENDDGQLSLREFRLAPIGCSYVTLRIYGRTDLNHDAALSWKEFYIEDSPEVIGLAWELFRRFDRNQNNQLELSEFEFRVDPTKLSPEKAFTFSDKNSDGQLALKEYLPLVASTKPQLAERNFKVVDFDRNGQLSLEEYKTLPGLFSVTERGAVPDPVADLATTAQKKWKAIHKAADQNTDGLLSEEEWPQDELQKQLPPLVDLKFSVWDTDQDGQVSHEEAEQLVAVAYGMKHLHGFPLRAPNGLVLYRSYIHRTDKDGDNQLSIEEYLPSIRRPKQQVQALFTKMDADKNGFLTYQELSTSSTTNIDELNFFLSFDKDLDGLLSSAELLKAGLNGVTELRLSQGLKAFDNDGDGKFSLHEFRLSPVGCSYVTLHVYDRKDENHDGMLSWEEFYQEPSPQVIGLAWELFRHFDHNQNGQLELNEFEFRVDPTKFSPEKAFTFRDKNSDGELTLEEYLPLVASIKPQLAKRNFNVVDFDRNSQLSLEEYKALPGLFSVTERGTVPDPVADLATTAQQTWQAIQKTADQNADGQLSQKEWPLVELQKQLTPLADVKFSIWDANQNGQVTQKEAEQLIAVAYGMKHLNGFPLRASNGLVLYRSYINPTDKDDDHQFSKEEYLPSIRRPKEQVQAEFTKMDTDQNGFLSYQEMTISDTTNIDELKFFLNSDKDLDGLVSPAELPRVNSNGATGTRVSQALPAFDEDGDGKFSLREFRLAPVGCNYVTLHVYGRTDQDHDGQLSWQEFYQEPSPQVIGLAWELFRRFDRDQNGQLDLSEFEFRVDPTKLSPKKAFAFRDKNSDGELTLEEYLPLVASTKPQLAKRNFNVVDFDKNDRLSLEEYKALPGLLPAERRGTIPDPVEELANAAQQTWQALYKAADQNSDDQLSEAEWPKAELQKQLTPLADVKFTVWDADQNGQVSRKEADKLIAIAYGMQQVNGFPLRATNGLVLYRYYIKGADKDGDHRLSKSEYLPSIRWPKEKVQAQFTKLDADQDEFLTYAELATSSLSNIDEFNFFLRSDTDLDGLLNEEELLKVGSNSTIGKSLSQGLKAFDEDGDAKFSLREFRLAPVGCNYVTLRVYGRTDLDHDGKLSWQEFYQEPSPQVIGLAWELFRRFDRNQDGQLDPNEFEFQYNPAKISPKLAFATSDKNSDGELTLEEYLPLVASTKPELAKRNFNVVDFDGNGQLTQEEYKALPGLFSAAERGMIPDPVADLAEIAQQKWKALHKTADRNKDGQLSQSEWPQANLKKQLTPLADLEFKVWDTDQNGQVTHKEAEQLLALAYGMKHLSGFPLRAPNGLVLYRSYINPTDKDGDHRLSKEEYLPSIRRPKEYVQSLFTGMDADQDGFLTHAELTTSPTTNIDEFSFFLNSDKDLDGFLSPEEILKIGSNGATELLLSQALPAFDENKDGKYSLREFRLSPLGCNYVTLRVYGRRDLDNNGTLSWKEFYQEDSPQLIGLAWELFSRFDRNQNNQLELSEFDFRYDPAKISPEIFFQVADKDKNGKLTFTEVFTDKAPEKKNSLEYQRYQIRQARAEDKFMNDDRNKDNSLDYKEFLQSRQAAAKIAERHRRAVGRTTADDGSKWLFPVIMTLNIVLLIGVAFYFMRRKAG
ncbi:hypothetical protein [Gimesia aquarii]|uniref:Transaldolase/EF-hand domain-containing protein n=1 Tax=Gimesia aquarii TaxID=2527964 RepID=A0A517VWZ3_9PLAN|nr:hypothetical protein [Gimesia aquarii]QDT97531.1 transaldolase/EF-hand domain-containing protein [Gimesia aquarii]